MQSDYYEGPLNLADHLARWLWEWPDRLFQRFPVRLKRWSYHRTFLGPEWHKIVAEEYERTEGF